MSYFDNSLSVADCQSDDRNSVNITTTSSSSITILSSSSINDSSSTAHEYTTERIRRLLKNNPADYKVIKNSNNKLSSMCWEVFGFPSKKSQSTQQLYVDLFISSRCIFQLSLSFFSIKSTDIVKHCKIFLFINDFG